MSLLQTYTLPNKVMLRLNKTKPYHFLSAEKDIVKTLSPWSDVAVSDRACAASISPNLWQFRQFKAILGSKLELTKSRKCDNIHSNNTSFHWLCIDTAKNIQYDLELFEIFASIFGKSSYNEY